MTDKIDSNELNKLMDNNINYRVLACMVVENMYRMGYIITNQKSLIFNLPAFDRMINIFYVYPTNIFFKNVVETQHINLISLIDTYKKNVNLKII